MSGNIRALQKALQETKGHVHMKYGMDKITSVAIPLAMTVASCGLIVSGINNLSLGKNRKEGF